MRKAAITLAVLGLAAATVPIAQAKPVAYGGKTEEGSKISFVLSGDRIRGELAVNWSWVDVSVPKIYTCLGNARFSAAGAS